MRHPNTILCASFLLLLSVSVLPAQSYPVRGPITNRDIVTLAKAGFDENFIIDIVHSSQKRLDTSVAGLADLAQQGISQRLIQTIMTPIEPVAPAMPVGVVSTTLAGGAYPASPTPPAEPRDYIVKASATNMAVSGNVPYYEWKSALWGLWRKKVGVAGVHRPGARIGVQIPASYYYTQYPRYSLPVGGPQVVQQPQLSPVLSHYVLPR